MVLVLGSVLTGGLLVWAPAGPAPKRGVVELGVAAEVLAPPGQKAPARHPTYGAAVLASLYGDSSFKAMLGFGFDHVVHGWLGDPEDASVATGGIAAGTRPRNSRGQLYRLSPVVRLGLENDVAFGYVGGAPGYAIRTATLRCVRAPCEVGRVLEHGLTMGLALGAMFSPSEKAGLVMGGEVGLDWSWFPSGHVGLSPWNQAMSARLVAGWAF
ncbi:MAG: hypothetical protein ACRBN8_38040 [Nannocystales bacterium]